MKERLFCIQSFRRLYLVLRNVCKLAKEDIKITISQICIGQIYWVKLQVTYVVDVKALPFFSN